MCSLNYLEDNVGMIHLPPIKGTDFKIELQFHEAIPSSEIQMMYIIGIRPSVIEIDKNRSIKLSYNSS